MVPFACSGPGAGQAIAESIAIGYTSAAIVGGLLMASLAAFAFNPRRWGASALLLGLLALHPAWTVSALSGDCGAFKCEASWFFTAVGCIALVYQLGCMPWDRLHQWSPARARLPTVSLPESAGLPFRGPASSPPAEPTRVRGHPIHRGTG
jgi:hypothetical protein